MKYEKQNTSNRDRGIFMEILEEEFKRKNIQIKMIGVKTSRVMHSLEKVSTMFGKATNHSSNRIDQW